LIQIKAAAFSKPYPWNRKRVRTLGILTESSPQFSQSLFFRNHGGFYPAGAKSRTALDLKLNRGNAKEAIPMIRRSIIEIDQEKCDGCGLCVSACAEGAIQLVDGKAKLVSETYCDGLGACLGKCPRNAITITEREAEPFDAAAVPHPHDVVASAAQPHLLAKVTPPQNAHHGSGCPGLAMLEFPRKPGAQTALGTATASTADDDSVPPLCHWPVQLHLVPPTAPFLKDAELFLVADCVPFACRDFHQRILDRRPVLIGCPKLDDGQAYVDKLAAIFRQNPPKSLTIVHMEVPCCSQLLRIAAEAIRIAGTSFPVNDITITRQGEILESV
jgi:ferredoxin